MNEDSLRRQGFAGGMTSSGFISKVLPMFSVGLIMTAAGSYFGWYLPPVFWIIAVVLELVMVFTSSKWAYIERGNVNIGIFLFFTTLTGISLVPILTWAGMRGGPGIIIEALGITVLTFGSLTAYGSITKKDFSGIGGFLMAALIGVIIASIVNIFIQATMFSLIISIISVVIFSAFILYDMAWIKRTFTDRDYIIASLALYINFIGLFQNILQILGILNTKDN
jgi:FtsH-binding integral membrane protein